VKDNKYSRLLQVVLASNRLFYMKNLTLKLGGNLKCEAALRFKGVILAVTDVERVKKPKLPKKRLLKKSIKRKRSR
jgi:hypothetical protein